ncbi:MAG: DUF1294 domain-containing protein [Clostridiales bacterium]|nr:DUF1294 domain-containing protein [Clostridiales bacterium]
MGNLILTLTGLLVLWNFCTFALMAIDKRKAIRGKRRIPERTLLLTAWALGGIGGFCGMILCSHKTKHLRFVIQLPLAAVLTLAAAVLLTLWLPERLGL